MSVQGKDRRDISTTDRHDALQKLDTAAPGFVEAQISGGDCYPESCAQDRHEMGVLPHLPRAEEKRDQLLREYVAHEVAEDIISSCPETRERRRTHRIAKWASSPSGVSTDATSEFAAGPPAVITK